MLWHAYYASNYAGIICSGLNRALLLTVLFQAMMYLRFFQQVLEKLCYACLPSIFDQLLSVDNSMVIVVSPLTSIIKSQVRN